MRGGFLPALSMLSALLVWAPVSADDLEARAKEVSSGVKEGMKLWSRACKEKTDLCLRRTKLTTPACAGTEAVTSVRKDRSLSKAKAAIDKALSQYGDAGGFAGLGDASVFRLRAEIDDARLVAADMAYEAVLRMPSPRSVISASQDGVAPEFATFVRQLRKRSRDTASLYKMLADESVVDSEVRMKAAVRAVTIMGDAQRVLSSLPSKHPAGSELRGLHCAIIGQANAPFASHQRRMATLCTMLANELSRPATPCGAVSP